MIQKRGAKGFFSLPSYLVYAHVVGVFTLTYGLLTSQLGTG